MSKLFSALLIIVATCGIVFTQKASTENQPPSQGIAPKVPNGIGRADIRVSDENGNPIDKAYIKLESTRSDGYFCETWGDTDTRGIIALLPIHMGELKLKVKAKGYRSLELVILASELNEPVRVTMKRK